MTRKPKEAPAEPPGTFRCALYSDGSLRLHGDLDLDEEGAVILKPAEARAVVQYLRTIGHLECEA